MEEKKQVALEQRSFEIKKQKRLNIFVHVVLTFGFQIILVAMVFYELWSNCSYFPNFFLLVNVPMLFGRFIATSILHLSLIDEVSAGLEIMKFALNHDYLF
jgi:hypothetical protein